MENIVIDITGPEKAQLEKVAVEAVEAVVAIGGIFVKHQLTAIQGWKVLLLLVEGYPRDKKGLD